MDCRPGCGACCIAPSISSPIPGMPAGKPAGVRCVHLTDDHLCALFGSPERPEICNRLRASVEMCGTTAFDAYDYLARLERTTRPGLPSLPVSRFIELLVTMLPADAGGRTTSIAPREGTYRPVMRSAHGGSTRIRFLEGPAQIAPGDAALVVAEIESGPDHLTAGDELDLIEPGERIVGIVTLVRLWRAAVSA